MTQGDASPAGRRRAAVVINATKIDDKLERLLLERFAEAGWAPPLWLETTPDDPGRAMTAQAVAAGVELVVAAGGDGTIRVVIAGLVGTDIPCALLPAGTVNLLARNIDLPLRLDRAIEVALGDHRRPIDLIKLTADDRQPEYFAVMAGLGLDAVILEQTDVALKRVLGPGAYAIAARKVLGREPARATITVDDQKPVRRRAVLCVIGNVGEVPGLISLIPEAKLDDGRLDLLVASPRRWQDWVRATIRILLRRHHEDVHLDHWTGRRVEIRVAVPEAYQLDGDTEGRASVLVAEVVPNAVTLMAPAPG
ncbi:diacylglycerol/lipid kinase family protein [Microlunatus speluncae]|uniref:diacylglycerol/lipid kinase family protein n=1 Tax=Microlunatus speluncae TaxID=2594267 RepID=UPI001266567C|nr:diacylglycerol kinase family protein [Microlunatus speluncae]